MIELKAVDRRHDSGSLVLEGLNLKVAPGEIVALVGAPSSGKSSLLRLLAGIDRPTAGEVLRRGEPARGPMTDAAFVFATPALMPWANVVTNVELPLRQFGQSEPAARERLARDALAAVGLADRAEAMPRELDDALRARVALARALITDPALLLLDGWLMRQAEADRGPLMQLLADRCRADARRSVVLATHDLEEAVWLAHRVVVLTERPGRIALDLRIDGPAVRDAAFRDSPAFAKACARLRRVLDSACEELAA